MRNHFSLEGGLIYCQTKDEVFLINTKFIKKDSFFHFPFYNTTTGNFIFLHIFITF